MIVLVIRFRKYAAGEGGYYTALDQTVAPFLDATPAADIALSLVAALAEEQGTATLTATTPEGENGDREGGPIKIISALHTRPYSLNLIKTKKAVPSHVILVIVNILLLLNRL